MMIPSGICIPHTGVTANADLPGMLRISRDRQQAADPGSCAAMRAGAFTLIELLVATFILALLLLLAVQVISQTNLVWSSTNSKIEQFREARVGFDSLIYRLGLATLNQYTGYEYANGGSSDQRLPTAFGRRSDLRFICGPASTILGNGDVSYPMPTDAVFFCRASGLYGQREFCAVARDVERLWVLHPMEQHRCRSTGHPPDSFRRELPFSTDAVRSACGGNDPLQSHEWHHQRDQ